MPFKWLSLLCDRFHKGEERLRESEKIEWETEGRGRREQFSTTAVPNNSPVKFLQRTDAQVPAGGSILRDHVCREINLRANLCEGGECFQQLPLVNPGRGEGEKNP